MNKKIILLSGLCFSTLSHASALYFYEIGTEDTALAAGGTGGWDPAGPSSRTQTTGAFSELAKYAFAAITTMGGGTSS